MEWPDDIQGLHASFFDAGSDLVLTNSFGGNALRIKLHDAKDCVSELNAAAARVARKAAATATDRRSDARYWSRAQWGQLESCLNQCVR